MTRRVIVAVDDSTPSLAAVAAAIEIALVQPIEIVFVTVRESGTDPAMILRHAERLATEAGIEATSIVCDNGPAFEAILAEADRQGADLIVTGRSDKQRPGAPHVGSQTAHILEFTELPVLVIPTPPTG